MNDFLPKLIWIGLCLVCVPVTRSVRIDYEGQAIDVDPNSFPHAIPLFCVEKGVTVSDCKPILVKTAKLVERQLLNFAEYEGALQHLQGVLVVDVEGIDIRSTAHHLCVGLKLPQATCAMFMHFTGPLVRRVGNTDSESCSSDQAQRGLSHFLSEIGGDDGLFSDDPSTFGILDLMRSTYSQADAFAFDGSDRKVKAFLASYFRSNLHWPQSPVHAVDLGAHRGGFLDVIIQSASGFAGSNANLHVISFEPNPSSFESLRTKVERGLQAGVSVSLVQGAVSNETKKGHIFVPSEALEIGYGVAVSELASISADSAPTGFVGVPTPIWSLDDWFSSELLHSSKEISLMKIDVEGFEPLVFDGAQQLLKGSLQNARGELIVPPRVILFEYGMGWALAANPATHRLETVVEALRKLGYSSYLLGEKQMLRLDGSCWHDAYEFWFWSNVVAIREEEKKHEKPVPLRTALSTLYSFVVQDI